jgi:hypothetical protein
MSLETWQAKYPVVSEGFAKMSLRQVIDLKNEKESNKFIWSARLSSGLFGLTDCPAGNSSHAPKGGNEVMLALGDEGLEHLIDLGFLPCPTCRPESPLIKRNLIPLDTMRLDWEKLAPYLTKMPNRIYTQPNLSEEVIYEFKERIKSLGLELPPIGFYDRTSATRFTEYSIK